MIATYAVTLQSETGGISVVSAVADSGSRLASDTANVVVLMSGGLYVVVLWKGYGYESQ